MSDELISSSLQNLNQQRFKALVSVAHDLQAPLKFMHDASDFIAVNHDKLTKKQLIEYLQKINIQTESCMHLIDGIVKGYQYNQASLKLNLEPTNMFLLADDVIGDLQTAAIHYGQHLSLESVKKLPLAIGDRKAISLAVYNLVEMLLKYSPTESLVKLKLSRFRNHVKLSLKSEKLYISKIEILRLLKQFANMRSPTKTFAANSGLGVFIAQNIISNMNGAFDIVKFKKGCSFNILLPVSEQQSLFNLESYQG
jgi:K+-sensing histidine kinase KdpD